LQVVLEILLILTIYNTFSTKEYLESILKFIGKKEETSSKESEPKRRVIGPARPAPEELTAVPPPEDEDEGK
jgi:hypothetical protein